MLLFNPSTYDTAHYDEPTRDALLAVRRFFEAKGHAAPKAESHDATWYDDFLAMIAREGIFTRFGTPAAVGTLIGGTGATMARWDTARNNDLSELLAQGGVFAFGLSEREHGADIYSTDMVLTQDGTGWRASGEKYCIGNGNCAARGSVFGRVQRPEGPSANPAGDYLFFLVDPRHPGYTLVQNVVHGQMYVSKFRLSDYPVTPADVLHTGKAAWDAALAIVNVGKVQLAWASIGIAEHAFVEAIQHAHHRVLYGTRVSRRPPRFRTLPKLEGTVHVNLALVLKFLPALLRQGRGWARSTHRYRCGSTPQTTPTCSHRVRRAACRASASRTGEAPLHDSRTCRTSRRSSARCRHSGN